MNIAWSRKLCGGLAAVVLLQSGCSGESGLTQAPQQPSEPVATSVSVSQPELSAPTTIGQDNQAPDRIEDLLVVDDSAQRTLDKAWNAEVAKCMAERGQTYDQTESPPVLPPRTVLGPLMDEDGYPKESTLRADGYTWRSKALMNADKSVVDSDASQEGPDLNLEECGASASTTLHQDELAGVEQLFVNADAERQVWEQTSPEVLELMSEWSDCMRAAGYDAGTFDQAISLASDVGFTSDEGISISVQDYSCRRQIGFNDRIRPIRQRYVAEWVDNNPGTIEAYNSALETAISAAQAAL